MGASKSTRNQYFAALSVNLISVSFGANFGWVSTSIDQLMRPETSRLDSELTNDGLGWLASVMSIGGLLGSIVFSWLADKFGRRACFLFMGTLVAVNWLLIIVARSLVQLCMARVLAGAIGGGCFAVIPVYITEMTEDRLRSTLGTFMSLSMCIGLLVMHILGYFLDYVTVAWIMLLIPAAFLCTFSFIPDTPEYLERYHKNGVEKSLRYFRGISANENAQLQVELTKLCKPFATLENGDQSMDNKLHLKDFTNRKARKAFFIGFGIILANQLSGCLTMSKYISVVFRDAGSSLSPIGSSIVVILIQLVGTYSATLFVERAGRKTLMLISTAGICLGQVSMAFYYYMGQLNIDSRPFNWLPIASLSFIMFCGSIGLLAVDHIVISEITPPKIRSVIVRVHMVTMSAISICLAKAFPHMSESMGISGIVSMFAVFSFLLTIFIALYVPETKGKSIQEIQASL
ncbi:facilitated trehalose transporter Tret1-like [Drosophila sulfurigaster albostrigata]|uniref:facilitated trehalose transporter Tret1-like n=1 Tax=Drosophila sulfurigaster albostrigata TaxID=89887 RepID=UPI002D21C38F|nr:facilitated trehalose transporter Tret1-like [Drosophila sulfurigaster albostrigata]